MENLQNKLSNIPPLPGVYLMKNIRGEIIYVGKAKNLKKRVSSYFQIKDHGPKTIALVKQIADIETIITSSEEEAFLLEDNLIKKHKPHYNIQLKDDKRYPYIAITINEKVPRVIYTRKLFRNGARYFGPYTDAAAAKKNVDLLNRIFKLKTCTKEISSNSDFRPCINYQIKRCSGICTGKITIEEYSELIRSVIKFLEGKIDPVLSELQSKMNYYKEEMQYEKAANIRDIIFDIQNMNQNQNVSSPESFDHDYLNIDFDDDEAIIVVFEFRNGILTGRKIQVYKNPSDDNGEEIIRYFIYNYYQNNYIPQKIITPMQIYDYKILENQIKTNKNATVKIKLGISQNEKSIINLIKKNLDVIISERVANRSLQNQSAGLDDLKKIFNLNKTPQFIVCFDISNIQGQHAVGSMSAFINGKPAKNEYRRFKIKGYTEANDPGMIHESVSRYIQGRLNESLSLPDIILIDGGPTQLTRALEVTQTLKVNLPVISIAKKLEELYYNPKLAPIRLPENSNALKILQNLRDEAHRFGISYHRLLRSKAQTISILDNIAGIGNTRKKQILSNITDLGQLETMTTEKMIDEIGLDKRTAFLIYNHFHDK